MTMPKALQDRMNKWVKLMPMSGPAETVEGEMIRAINKILYRYYNDGDYWFEGYGCETAGSAAAYLMQSFLPISLFSDMNHSDGAHEEEYEKPLWAVANAILDHIESGVEFTPNDLDMLDFEPRYEPEYEDDCYEDNMIYGEEQYEE